MTSGRSRREAENLEAGGRLLVRAPRERQAMASHRAADERARVLSPIVRELRQAGFMTLRAMADELNKRRIRTAHGGSWHPSTVSELLERLASAKPLIAEMPR